MSRHFLVCGTHPLLSLAEAKAVLGGRRPEIAQELAVFDTEGWDGAVLQNRLAGTVKLGDVIWEGAVRDLTSVVLADHIDARPRHERVIFGLTVFGGSETAHTTLKRLPLELKRELSSRKRSSRWVTGENGPLSPAAVAKLKLTTDGYDLVVGIFGNQAVVGLTTHVQNADAWSERDYGRPFRDAKTGMLPPKLARLMVNLAQPKGKLLDPFCGGGTVLMEASLLGIERLIGSDLDARQVDGAGKNLDWMEKHGMMRKEERVGIKLIVCAADAIDRHVPTASVDAIVTEGFLGQPLRGHESATFLNKQKDEIEKLWRKTLPVLARTMKKGGRLVCTWPVFVSKQETVAIDLTSELAGLGFERLDPLAGWKDKPVTLTYARPDQKVRRNVLVLAKK